MDQKHVEEEEDETEKGKLEGKGEESETPAEKKIQGNCKRKNRYLFRILYKMVDDPLTDTIVSWSETDKSFVIWKETEFCRDVLPRFLQYTEMAPFVRRLEWDGFKKVGSERWEYAHNDFLRGHSVPELPPEVVSGRLQELASAARERQAERAQISESNSIV